MQESVWGWAPATRDRARLLRRRSAAQWRVIARRGLQPIHRGQRPRLGLASGAGLPSVRSGAGQGTRWYGTRVAPRAQEGRWIPVTWYVTFVCGVRALSTRLALGFPPCFAEAAVKGGGGSVRVCASSAFTCRFAETPLLIVAGWGIRDPFVRVELCMCGCNQCKLCEISSVFACTGCE